jgi:histidine triad (HIT) family protein
MSDCLFCKIIDGVIPSTKVFENENVYAFTDINPLAKEHFLFISKNHSKNILEMPDEDMTLVMKAIKEFASQQKMEKDGFRVVTNINEQAGQTVFHTHFHVLGGEQLRGFGA